MNSENCTASNTRVVYIPTKSPSVTICFPFSDQQYYWAKSSKNFIYFLLQVVKFYGATVWFSVLEHMLLHPHNRPQVPVCKILISLITISNQLCVYSNNSTEGR